MATLRPHRIDWNTICARCEQSLREQLQLVKAILGCEKVSLVVTFEDQIHCIADLPAAIEVTLGVVLGKLPFASELVFDGPSAELGLERFLERRTRRVNVAVHRCNRHGFACYTIAENASDVAMSSAKRQALAICSRQIGALLWMAYELQRSDRHADDLRVALASARAGGFSLDVAKGHFFCNPSVRELLALGQVAPDPADDFDQILDLIEAETRASFLYAIGRASNVGGLHRHVFQLQANKRWIAASFARDASIEQPFFVGMMRDYTEQRELELENEQHQQQLETLVKDLRKSSRVDVLTGLMNRAGFNEQFQVIASNQRRNNEWLSILIIDVDHFKSFNDSYGHAEGDVTLKQVATEIARSVRGADIAVRFGGEEFCVLSFSNPELAVKIAERIRLAVEQSSWKLRKVTVSIGIESECGAIIDQSTMFKRADDALYRAKANGRNCIVAASDNENAI